MLLTLPMHLAECTLLAHIHLVLILQVALILL